jgi:3-hydroxyisobutyrate dehydrogenase-like beta-hydroxyacid dehydrogenase
MMADIGLIGVGLVGSALAERFRAGGLSLVAFDRRPECLTGLTAASSARAAAEAAPVVVLSLPDSDAVGDVVEMALPVLAGRTVLDTTTGDPDRTADLGRRLKAAGVDYVDATIAGSSRQVRAGTAVVMAGGEPDVIRRCERLFGVFASRWFQTGPWGSGARMKLVVNLVLGLNRAALAEGLAFARATGLEPAAALDVLMAGPAYSHAMDTKGPKMISGDFTPDARLSQHHKDVRLILAAAERAGIELPMSEVHDRLLTVLEGQGMGDLDNSAIIRAFARGKSS